jgi:hypothetical protein
MENKGTARKYTTKQERERELFVRALVGRGNLVIFF